MITLLKPENGATVPLSTDVQKHFIQTLPTAHEGGTVDWLHLAHSGEKDETFPLPVSFRWEGCGMGRLYLAADPKLENARVYPVKAGKAEIENLEIGKTYYWRVEDSPIFSFTTEAFPARWIRADGLTNIRDAGGWTTKEGKLIRQGLLFRGSEMDSHCIITSEGVRALRDDIHIHTDLDLRAEAVGRLTESPLGRDIRFENIPVQAYGAFLEEKERARRVFCLLADEAAYPIYYHCWGGADRTGTVAYLLGALLGMTDEDLALDYELTSLSVWADRSRESALFRSLLDGLAPYGEDADTETRVRRYLLSTGLDEETLERIKGIYLS